MAGELKLAHETGDTVYFVIMNAAGELRRSTGGAFEAIQDANWPDYAIPGVEQGTTGIFLADAPSLPAGRYTVLAYEQIGTEPDPLDLKLGAAELEWDGAAEVVVIELVAAIAAAIATRVLEGSVTWEEALRAIAGEAVGDIAVNEDESFSLLSLDGTQERATATIGLDGTRTVSARDLS